MSGQNRGGGARSNMYSESKFSNWASFDPFRSEIQVAEKLRRPAARFKRGDYVIPIYARDLSKGFVRPLRPKDVVSVLGRVPLRFLDNLDGVYLLGGTKKQLHSRNLRYGTYTPGRIFLHALKERALEQFWVNRPKPSTMEEYARIGAIWQERSDGWYLVFDQDSLRRFYMYDVLLHELGHHADCRVWERPEKSAENYADWLARELSTLILSDGADPPNN